MFFVFSLASLALSTIKQISRSHVLQTNIRFENQPRNKERPDNAQVVQFFA
jgi:hypothetical protein